MPPLCENPSASFPGDEGRSLKIHPARLLPGDVQVCVCKKHHRGGEAAKPRMKYVQPEKPAPHKPENRYSKPRHPFDSGTVYKLSYPGVDAETMRSVAGKPLRLRDNIAPSNCPFERNTTSRLSYAGAIGERTVPYKPLPRIAKELGPMQSMTTNRHDFSPKPIPEKPVLPLAPDNIGLSSAKMEDSTTTRLSYRPVEAEKAHSYKPIEIYRKPDRGIETGTVNRLSYRPWDPVPKEVYPWMEKARYRQPERPVDAFTVYRASYLPNESVERARPCIPERRAFTFADRLPMDAATIYRESYRIACEGICKPERVKRTENILLSNAPMSRDTTFRCSYTGVGGERPAPYRPVRKSLAGSGPMQSVTTQRHDFTRKPFVSTENFRPRPYLPSSDHKMDDVTTFRASYRPNETYERAPSYKPMSVYRPPDSSMDSETINRSSYRAWDPIPKQEIPWKTADLYRRPEGRIDGTTVYRGSYFAPGVFVPDGNSPSDEKENDCLCSHPDLCKSATEDL